MSTTTRCTQSTPPQSTQPQSTRARAGHQDPYREATQARAMHGGDEHGRRASQSPGLRQLLRPATANAPEFVLAYARQGPRLGTLPVLVVPGGPGVASVLPYRRLRARAAQDGLDLLMVEHRGVGLSRLDVDGAALPPQAITLTDVVSDLVAVLDHEGIDRVVLLGSGYGSLLAAALIAAHPQRVVGLVLDSPVLDGRERQSGRQQPGALLWDGDCPQTAALLREVVDGGTPAAEATAVARTAYESGGPGLVRAVLVQRRAGRADRTWRLLGGRDRGEPTRRPYLFEPDLVAHLGDGAEFDPEAVLARADRPTVILSGERDLLSPPAGAARLAARVPDAVLVPLPDTGHGALDGHPRAALESVHAVRDGELDLVAERLAALRRPARARRVSAVARGLLLVDRVLTP